MEKYITNGFLKIINPQLQQNSTYNYSGNIADFDFASIIPTQFKNYQNIKQLLNLSQIYFTEINVVKWNSNINYSSTSRCKFIIKTSNPNLLWYKYDAEAPGGGNNLIYYKKRKIKTTSFIDWNEYQLNELFHE